jgi:alpha-2-macroglobulin
MRSFLAALGFASFALVVTTSGQTFGPAPTHTIAPSDTTALSAYEDLLATARRYAAEKSWALARDAFAAARPHAPNEEAAQWCDLWLLDASWRSSPRADHDGDQSVMETFDRLLAPYAAGRPRDAFWIDCLESRAAAKRYWFWAFRKDDNAWSDELAIADHLANQPINPATTTRYIKYVSMLSYLQYGQVPLRGAQTTSPVEQLRHAAEQRDNSTYSSRQHNRVPFHSDQQTALIEHLRRAAELSTDSAKAARLSLHAIDLAYKSLPENRHLLTRLMATAVKVARGGPFESTVHAREFIWRAKSGALTPDKDGRPDLPAWLREIDSLILALESAPADEPVASVRKSLIELKTRWSERRLELVFGKLFRLDEPLRFTLGTAYISKLDFAVHRIAPRDWLQMRSVQPPYFSPDPVLTWSVDLITPNAAAHHWQSRIESFPSPLPPGLYALLARDETGTTQFRPFAITSAAASALRTGDNRWEYFCYDNKIHIPLTPRGVQVWTLPYTGDPFRGTLDLSGRLTVPFPSNQNLHSAILIFDDGHPVIFDRFYDYERRRNDPDELHLDAFLPRELYRPGETVHWKLIARHRRDGRFVKPEGKLTLKISLDDTPLGDPREITWDEAGSASGDLVIPINTRPGRARLALVTGKGEDEEELADTSFFTVDNFLPPPALTSLELIDDPASLRPGSTATLRVNARYFSGGPITGAPVELNCVPHLPDLDRDAGEDGLPEKNAAISTRRNQWKREISAKVFHATTDAAGMATFTIDLPDFLPPTFFMGLNHTVKPSGLPELRSSKAVTVTASGLHLDFPDADKPRSVRPGEKISLRFRYLDAFARPAPVSGEVSLIESRWQEVWLDPSGQPVTGPALAAARRSLDLTPDATPPAGWKKIHAAEATTAIDTAKPVATSDGWATVTFTAPHAGCFRFEFHADTGSVTVIKPEVIYGYEAASLEPQLYVVGDDTRTLDLPPAHTRLIGPAEITAGEKPRFLAVLPENTRHGFLALNGENGTRTHAFTTEGRIAEITFENPPPFSDLASARLIFPGRVTPYDPDHTFAVHHPQKAIHTEIVPHSNETRPGTGADIIVRTRDHAGHPLPATVAFAASDQAVNQLLSENREHAPRFLSYDEHVASSIFQTGTWQKKNVAARFTDPRDGLAHYKSAITAEEGDIVELSPFSLNEGTETFASAGMSVSRNTISADAFGALENKSETLSDAHTGDLVASPPRPDPSSTLLGQSSAPKPVITLRRHFASTAFWAPSVKTDAKGEARVSFKYPDNLTEWRLAAYAVGPDGNTFGTATAFTRTSLPLQARLQTPRFLIAGDTADLSATLLNRTRTDLSATASLQITGAPLAFASPNDSIRSDLAVPQQGEARTAWSVRADQPGTATLTLSAHTATEGDAMQLPLPVHEDGIRQSTAVSARLAHDAKSARFTLTLPTPLDPARTEVTLHLSPSRATTVLDALPYVIDYPYGCVEQTLSRFLPAVIVKQTLADFGLDTAALEKRILARPAHARTQPRGAKPAFAQLDDVIAQSLARLATAKRHDGFGWWPGSDKSDLWMTAYVAWGLTLATDAKITLPEDLASDTNDALEKLLAAHPPADDTTAWALAAAARALGQNATPETKKNFARLFDSRDALSAHGRACLLLAAAQFGTPEQRDILLRNLENGATRHRADDLGDTVHWGETAGFWRASDSAIETTALTLLALLETNPEHPLIETAVNWLVLNRRSAHWTNTRDTAFAILALTRHLALSKEAAPDSEVEVHVNNRPLPRLKFDAATLLTGDTSLLIETSLLRPGENKIELRRLAGQTPVYALALSSSWARGESVQPASHLSTVARTFERQKTHITLAGTLSFTPEPLPAKGSATAGEQVTARVTLTVPNDLEYVMVEVPKPAGCEPINPLSGWDARLSRIEKSTTPQKRQPSDKGRRIYREERDDKSVFFLDEIEAGTWEINFSLRAVHPGNYRALPVHVEAMYAPEVRANSDARRLSIER